MSLGLLGFAAMLASIVLMGSFVFNPWRLDLRKLMQAQSLFWFGMLAMTMAAFTALVVRVTGG